MHCSNIMSGNTYLNIVSIIKLSLDFSLPAKNRLNDVVLNCGLGILPTILKDLYIGIRSPSFASFIVIALS